MLSEEVLKKRARWYSNVNVQFELVRAMRNREVVFMSKSEPWKCIRGLFIGNVQYLQRLFKVFKFYERDYNIYISVAKYKSIPSFTYNLTKRSEQTKEWFRKDAKDQIISYNILYDFDNKFRYMTSEREEFILNGVKRTKPIFKEIIDRPRMIREIQDCIQNLRHRFYVIPSGTNFQIIEENNYPLPIDEIKSHLSTLKGILRFHHLDLAGAGHHFKLMKCPYSLVDETVVFPMYIVTYDTLNDYDYFDCNNILAHYKLGFRGIKYKNPIKLKVE